MKNASPEGYVDHVGPAIHHNRSDRDYYTYLFSSLTTGLLGLGCWRHSLCKSIPLLGEITKSCWLYYSYHVYPHPSCTQKQRCCPHFEGISNMTYAFPPLLNVTIVIPTHYWYFPCLSPSIIITTIFVVLAVYLHCHHTSLQSAPIPVLSYHHLALS